MKCFILLTVFSLFPEVIASDAPPRCENGVCRLPTSASKPKAEPTPIAPLPTAKVDERPQQSVLVHPLPAQPSGLLRRLFFRRR